MKHISRISILPGLVTMILASYTGWSQVSQYVNPFIGTSGKERALEGRTNPGALVPFGMASVCPFNAYDTSLARNIWDHARMSAPYFKGRAHISGFSHVNLSGVGCPEMGIILLMPSTGELMTDPANYMSEFDEESASPGFYQVNLKRYHVKASMTATTRVGISRYVFPGGRSHILVNLGLAQTNQRGAYIRILSSTRIEGWRNTGRFCGAGVGQKVFFAIEFSKPASRTGTWKDEDRDTTVKSLDGNNIGAFAQYDTREGDVVEVKLAVSYVSTSNAWANMEKEQPGFAFDKIKKDAAAAWEKELSVISVRGGSREDRTLFYTALYHCLIHPNIISDINGEYPSMKTGRVDRADGYEQYSIFSLWDTYRNLHPLLTLVYPERQQDMIRSMLAMYKAGGWLPKWELAGNETNTMVGDPAIPVIADSYLKGIRGFDIRQAYEAMKKSATMPEADNPMRPGMDAYLSYGYIPMGNKNPRNVWGEVSTSLEYYVADHALGLLAVELKKDEDAAAFLHRADGYRHFFNPENGFLAPRLANGSWYQPFDPLYDKWPGGPGYVEGNAWHYRFFVPHDMPGLIELFGSGKRFVDSLQACFDQKHFSMGNEPDIAYPFLFNYVKGEAWRTQKEVRAAIRGNYANSADGLPGNDDCGTMSAWLVFAMMGFYPDCPGIPVYQLSGPVFEKITIRLNHQFYPGREFSIQARNHRPGDLFIQSIRVNHKPYDQYTLNHEMMVNGGTLEFMLGPDPLRR